MATIRDRLRKWLGIDDDAESTRNIADCLLAEIATLSEKYDTMISALENRAKSKTFDRDTIPVSKPGPYVPVARRRAMAEAQSLGPATHNDEVRRNNAKAFGE